MDTVISVVLAGSLLFLIVIAFGMALGMYYVLGKDTDA